MAINHADIRVPRSAIMQFSKRVTSFKHGEIVPIKAMMVQPGDTLKMHVGSLIRMNTPIAPFAGEIECELNAFFVPNRLSWSKWKQFYGENENSAGIPELIDIELLEGRASDIYKNGVPWNSVSAYLGKPIVSADATKHCLTTLWKEKAYYRIVSEHYRATMLQDPFILDDNPYSIGSVGGITYGTNNKLSKVCKSVDMFTAATQSPQYGDSVLLPLGSTAPVYIDSNNSSPEIDTELKQIEGTKYGFEDVNNPGNDLLMYADLSEATAASVNLLRLATATQRYREASLFGGSVYWGQLQAHFGVTPPDSTLQRSERLGTINFTLNVSQVTAMGNNTINGVTQPAGSVGAISVTGNGRNLFTKGFTEHGVVLVLLHTRIKQQSYVQGVLREDTKTKLIDYFSPEYAHIGNVAIKNKELFVTGDPSIDEDVFGYQEAWYENRYVNPLEVTGVCNPAAGAGVAVDVWSLANNFASTPELNASFIEEDRNNVASRLITGTSSNYDYIGEFSFAVDKISITPLHSQPGLMDHVGNM